MDFSNVVISRATNAHIKGYTGRTTLNAGKADEGYNKFRQRPLLATMKPINGGRLCDHFSLPIWTMPLNEKCNWTLNQHNSDDKDFGKTQLLREIESQEAR